MRIIRVFPRRTNATPDDELAYIGEPDLFSEADRVMVDCTFTWDKPEAERLSKAWNHIATVTLGGCAYGDPGGAFTPGMFLKNGYTITSRGCNNKCWFCYVWKRSGNVRELEIKDGWIIADDNLLACSEKHIRDVFAMLKRQPHKPIFTGGLEAKLLKDWHIELLQSVKPQRLYFAYDTEDDYEPLLNAKELLQEVGIIPSHNVCVYCLIGYPKDTFENAETRMKQVLDLGMMPFAMLYRNDEGKTNTDWRKFQRLWARPSILYARVRA